uniref:Phage portal protein n=1 Tax=Elaeophora elaphi TaxID=1147741 RepID=A0A0R3RL63_9BILA
MGITQQIQERLTYKAFTRATNFSVSEQVISSMLHLSRYLQNKSLFIDPRFIFKMQDVQTHFTDGNQLHIGEESLDEILESNTVMMALFDRDRSEIVCYYEVRETQNEIFVGPMNWTTFV